MNYKEFIDEENQIQRIDYTIIQLEDISEVQMQQILRLNIQFNIPLPQSIYYVVIEKQQLQNTEDILHYCKILYKNDHFYTEYNFENQCAICYKDNCLNKNQFQKRYKISQILTQRIQNVRTCLICFNYTFEESLVFFNQETHNICNSCFKNFLEVQISEGQVRSLTCPHCQSPINEVIIEKYAPKMIGKFQRFLKNIEIATSKNKFWCPNEKCENLIQFENETSITCDVCRTKACTKCKQLIHDGLSCEEYFRQLMNNIEPNIGIKCCPNCRCLSQKIGGCDLMTCSNCQLTWCWNCNIPATYGHLMNCPYVLGMDPDDKCLNCFKIILWYLCLLLIFLFCLILGPIILFVTLLKKQQFYKDSECFKKMILLLCFILIGVLATPVFIIFGAIFLIPLIIYIIVLICKQELVLRNYNINIENQLQNNHN